ncbi:DUF5320 domain-containing protein [candidate division WOR-3 bacterium]|nr:DUF5320 domain-containing protein [candidate division WOR-3 bacterium]
MPGGNGTGPLGGGPMTGRRMGYCAGYSVPGYMNGSYWGGGGGWGSRGRGFRRMFYATGVSGWMRFGFNNNPSVALSEKDALKNTAESLKSQLDEINKKLSELEGDN